MEIFPTQTFETSSGHNAQRRDSKPWCIESTTPTFLIYSRRIISPCEPISYGSIGVFLILGMRKISPYGDLKTTVTSNLAA
jgi:hypothetical protein